MSTLQETSENLLSFCGDKRYSTIYADPPWRFQNRTGKVAPENKKLNRYETMPLEDIMALPVEQVAAAKSHLYLWVPNALLPDGLAVMKAWGFEYKGNIIWEKVRKDGGPDGRGVGFYFRNVTEILLLGSGATILGRWLQPVRRSISFGRKSVNTHGSLTRLSRLLKAALRDRSLSYLLVVTVKAGICGETKRPQIMSLRGALIKTTPRNKRTQNKI